MPVDVRDITQRAEVAHSTVSQTLNHHLAITHETVERTRRLARELSHATNHFICSWKTSRFHMVGIIAHRIADLFYREPQGGLKNVAYSLIIGDSIFNAVQVNKSGIHMPKVFILHRIT